MTWREVAYKVLAEVFGKDTRYQPTRKQLIAAYPFGMRKYWPYKCWLRAVREWKAARAVGLTTPNPTAFRWGRKRRGPGPRNFDQLDLL